MRERIFRRILRFLETHPSKLAARIQIQILFLVTARAFGLDKKWILFSGDALKAYAEFTRACMETPADQKRLYLVSKKLGRKIRRITGFKDPEDLKRLVFLLYKNIGITMTGDIPGRIVVSECFFSSVYTAKQCRCISAMDAGIIKGICGGETLRFTRRITEGCGCCMACIPLRKYS